MGYFMTSPFIFDRKVVVNLLVAIVLCALMLFLTFFSTGMFKVTFTDLFSFDKKSISHISIMVAWIISNLLFVLTLLTGKIDRFRAIFFILIAVMFPIGFIMEIYELRGHFMIASFENIIRGEIPFCHIVITQTLLPMLFNKTIIFPGTILPNSEFRHTIAGMIVLWFAASVGTGRGWCSWICFFGGWEDGFSRILRRPVIRKISPILKYVPYAILVSVVLLSFAFAVPVYCWWLCPFKSVSEFVQVLSPVNVIQTVIFVLLFIALVVVLPLLTKKRTQCGYFCPFGAMQSLFDKVNVYDVRADTTKCVNCGKCIRECPMNSISEKSLADGKTGNTCVKCGKCIDICPKKAMSLHIKGTTIGGVPGKIARLSFLFLCYVILASMGGSFISKIVILNREQAFMGIKFHIIFVNEKLGF